jgi:hypothetical protein
LVISAAENVSHTASFDHHAAQSTLELESLTVSPYRSSLWLLSSVLAVNLFVRRHPHLLLRC